jgi:hypothetical protein
MRTRALRSESPAVTRSQARRHLEEEPTTDAPVGHVPTVQPRTPGESVGSGGSQLSGGDGEKDIGDSDGDTEAADHAFSARRYEARRGDDIPPRFDIPEKFDPRYPVGFEAESVAYNRTLYTAAASAGREAEANALYASAAYLT